MTEQLTDEHKQYLISRCNQLSYPYPCYTASCLKRANDNDKATCVAFEIYNYIVKLEDVESDNG